MTNDIHSPSASPSSWEELPNEHLPRPTYFPAGVAMGLTFLFWGLITSYITALVGLGLFAAAFAGWIREIRHEHHR